MNEKGISLVSLVITIIVIIILAAISFVGVDKYIDEANKAKFQNDLTVFVEAINVYHERAQIYGVSTYKSNELKWDGVSEKAENSAKMEDKSHIEEDSIYYILDENQVPSTLVGIVTIEDGKVKVDKTKKPEIEWAVEKYSYMGE